MSEIASQLVSPLSAIAAAFVMTVDALPPANAEPLTLTLVRPVPEDLQIIAPGKYMLSAPLSSEENEVIRIKASHVSLDLNGKTVACAPSDPTSATTIGIHVLGESDIAISNGSITGCMMGINAPDADRLSVKDVTFARLTYIGINFAGTGAVIENNKFLEIAGYTKEAYAVGISAFGLDCVVSGNEFREIYRQPGAPATMTGEGVAILLGAGSRGCEIRRNWLENDRSAADTIGVWLANDAVHAVTENNITNFQRGIIDAHNAGGEHSQIIDNRIWLRRPIAGSIGVYSGAAEDNVVLNYELPIHPSNDKTQENETEHPPSNFVGSD